MLHPAGDGRWEESDAQVPDESSVMIGSGVAAAVHVTADVADVLVAASARPCHSHSRQSPTE